MLPNGVHHAGVLTTTGSADLCQLLEDQTLLRWTQRSNGHWVLAWTKEERPCDVRSNGLQPNSDGLHLVASLLKNEED